jgi:hypothetical protein
LESKNISLNVCGKDGFVLGKTIQQHNPSSPMILIGLESGHFLFCQTDHPVIVVHPVAGLHIKEAGKITSFDSIYVNNDYPIPEKEIVPDISPEDMFEKIHLVATNRNINMDDKYIKGNFSNFRLHPQFYSFKNDWLEEFIKFFTPWAFSICSINFLSQLKTICDKLDNYSFEIECSHDKPCGCWFLYKLSKLENSIPKITGYVPVKKTNICKKYKFPVYDIKTSSEEFMIGSVQTHNSFHLGGSISLRAINLKEELMVNTDEHLRKDVMKGVSQVDYSLYAKTEMIVISIDKSIYKKSSPITRKEGELLLPVGYFELKYNDLVIRSSIEQETIIHLPKDKENIEEDSRYINILYGDGEKMYTVYPVPKDYTKLAQVMDGLVGGKSPSFDPSSLYLKFMRSLYAFDEPYDSVHIEVILSNILRNKKNPQKPARLVEPYEYELHSIKTLPSLISWPLGICFENFNAAISAGLISDRGPSSPIEKVFFGEPLLDVDKDGKIKK